MKVPNRAALLAELDSLSHGARMARAALLGREGRGTPELLALMEELLAGDTYEANLALTLAQAARAEHVLLRALSHPSRRIRARAASLAGQYVQDSAALERAVLELSPEDRHLLLRSVLRTRRSALAARLFPKVHTRHGAREAVRLLAVLDDASVRHLLPELGHLVQSWRSLVWRYPDAVLEHVRARLGSATERERGSLFWHFHSALEELTYLRGEAVLELTRQYMPPGPIPGAVYGGLRRLTRNHPDAVFALLTHPATLGSFQGPGLPPGVLQEAASFSREQRLALAKLVADNPRHLGALLAALAPSLRAELFEHVYGGHPPRDLPAELLTVLPHTLRDAEAARRLGYREVTENRSTLLATQALRTIEHSREPLMKAAFAAKAEDRAEALTLLVRSTGLSRRGLTETLAALARLRNEQDPVRMAALQELARVPISLFQPEHLPALAEQVTFAVEARDASYGTRGALQELAFRLMRAHASEPDGPHFQFALQTLRRLAGQAGSLALPPLERDLPRGAEVRIVAALMPMIRSAGARDSHLLVLTLARALGRRGWDVDLLQALLKPATQAESSVARAAIDLWLAPPRTRDARVRELLNPDESVVTIPCVLEHLHRRRQEWLDPFLQGRRLTGRFSPGKAGWVPPVTDGFIRWLPRQQRQFGELLLLISNDRERSAWERMHVLRVLSQLPVTTVDTLRPFVGSPDVPTAEAALGALAWIDQPQTGLPLLLDNVDGDRARVAMYAIPRVARLIPGEALASALGSLLARERLKVTVQKEAMRLLGTFRSAHSLPLLRAQWEKPELHRDVRIAVGHAARQLLDQEEAWTLLDAMARGPDAAVAASLLSQRPEDLPVEVRPRYTGLILQVARHPDPQTRRLALTALPAWSPGSEQRVAEAVARRVLDLEGGADWLPALQALVLTVSDGVAVEHLLTTAEALLAQPVPSPYNATAERDVPARQRLDALFDTLFANVPRQRLLRLRGTVHTLAGLLSRDETLGIEAARLRLGVMEWTEASTVATKLLALAERLRAEPLFEPALAQKLTEALSATRAEWAPERLLEVADRVGGEAPFLAVALVGAAGERLHWRADAGAGTRLRALREHPRPAVRAAALAVLTRSERAATGATT
ncbi:hypothetical protein P2318_06860 [Myxococcaceae bacterium GXIMD 01537]